MKTQNKTRTALYPGTFDPVTKGHLQLIRRASLLVDKLIVGVADSRNKRPLFTMDERVAMLRADLETMEGKGCAIEVQGFDSLLVHFARDVGASAIFRGLRASSDFEYEFQLTGMNAKLDPDIETIFLMASDKWQFVSSSFVKEICELGGDIDQFVTPQAVKKLREKFS